LKGFAKVALEAGEEKEVDVILTGADLAYYNVEKGKVGTGGGHC